MYLDTNATITISMYLNFKKQIKKLQKIQLLHYYARDCQKVDPKHQNQKAPLIKKGFNCKKKEICFDPAHTQNICMIKTGIACIRKGFSKIENNFFSAGTRKKEKKRTAFLPTSFLQLLGFQQTELHTYWEK